MKPQTNNNAHPPYIIYSNPTKDYHYFVNRFCQSKSKMKNCFSKQNAIEIVNAQWEEKKKDKDLIHQYINTPPSLPWKPTTNSQKSLKNFFNEKAKDNGVKHDIQNKPDDFIEENGKNHDNTSLPSIGVKRKYDNITNSPKNEPTGIKKSKSNPIIYNLNLIVNYMFKDNDKMTHEEKLLIENELQKDVVLHENMFICLTEYIEQKSIYEKNSSFSIKDNVSTKRIQSLEASIASYGDNIKSLRNIKNQMKEFIENGNLTNTNQLIQFERELAEIKNQNCLHMINISSLISLVLNVLKKRISNVKYYKKSSLAPDSYQSPLKFFCFNMDSD